MIRVSRVIRGHEDCLPIVIGKQSPWRELHPASIFLDFHDGHDDCLITARKKLYLESYCQQARLTEKFGLLKHLLVNDINLLLIDESNGPDEKLLSYYMDRYNVSNEFIEEGAISVNHFNIAVMLNDLKRPFGTGYALGAALLNLDQKLITDNIYQCDISQISRKGESWPIYV